jgi:cyclophilin family peptidyl-prolyl cis-trans isomerase
MKTLTIALLTFLFAGTALAAKPPKNTFVEIKTSMGDMVVMLYNDTPLHKENFLKLVAENFYDSLIFHRVIKDFMIQGGDPASRNPVPGKQYGSGGPDYTVPAEFRDNLFHKKGVLSAARTGDNVNPEKRSSGSQFYIVQGKVYPDEELKKLEGQMRKTFSEEQKQAYRTLGGTPFLDGNYTVFGEVVKGLELVDVIAGTRTLPGDRPAEDVFILSMQVLKKFKPEKK